MNSDNLEKLRELIKEGQDLSQGMNGVIEGFEPLESEVERIHGTDYWVKAGKLEDFKHRAYVYYQDYLAANNSFLKPGTSDDEIAKTVYELISKEMLEENNEYYNAKAYDLYEGNQELISKLEELEKALRNVNGRYAAILQELNAARETLNTASAERRDNAEANLRNIEEDLQMITNSKNTVTANLAQIKAEINAKFVESIEEQLNLIRNNYFQATKITNPSYSKKDGRPVLDSDLEEYDALLELLDLASSADLNNYTTLVNSCVCLNNGQINKAEELINKTNLFKKLKKQEPTDIINVKNDKLIEQIIAELRNIEARAAKSKTELKPVTTVITVVKTDANGVETLEEQEIEVAQVTARDYDEYVTLFNTLKALNKVKNSYVQQLTNVWDIAYIDINDVPNFRLNFPKTKFFNRINPQNIQKQKNQELITKLKKYIEEKAKIAEEEIKKSNRNLDVRRINVDGIDVLVQGEAYPECFRLANIISLLNNANNIDLKSVLANPNITLKEAESLELKEVMGLAYISKAYASKLEELIKSSAFFGFTEPVITAQESLEEQINNKYNQILALVKKTEGANPSLIDSNGLILKDDYDKFDSLVDQYVSLSQQQKARKNPNEYRIELETTLKSIANPIDFSIHNVKIAELKAKRSSITIDSSESMEYANNLDNLIQLLENAKSNSNLEEINGIYVPGYLKDYYNQLINKIETYEKSLEEPEEEKDFTLTDALIKELNDKATKWRNENTDINAYAEEDYNYYLHLLEQARILGTSKSVEKTVKINGVYVDANKEDYYKELVAKIEEYEVNNGLNNNHPDFDDNEPENEKKIAELNAILAEMDQEEKLGPELTEKYNLYELLRDIIEEGLTASDTILVDNLKIPASQETLYNETKEKIEKLNQQALDNQPDSKLEEAIKKLEEALNSINMTSDSPMIEQMVYNNYKKILDIYKNSLKSTITKDVKGLPIDAQTADECLKLLDENEKLMKSAQVNENKKQELKDLLNDPFLEDEIVDLYNEQYKILDDALTTPRMTIFRDTNDGTIVESSKLNRYNGILSKIKELKAIKELPEANANKIAEINEELSALEYEAKDLPSEEKIATSVGSKVATDDLEEYELLVEQKEILKRATSKTDTGTVNINDEDSARYAEIVAKLRDIAEAKKNRDNSLPRAYVKAEEELMRKPKREKVTIRKAAVAALKAIKESIKIVMAGGLGMGAAYLAGNTPIGAALGALGVTSVFVKESFNKAKINGNSDYGFESKGVEAIRNVANDYNALIGARIEKESYDIDTEIVEDATQNPDDAELQRAAEQARKNIEERFAKLKALSEFSDNANNEEQAEEDFEEQQTQEEPPVVINVPEDIDAILNGLGDHSMKDDLAIHKRIDELQKRLDNPDLSKDEKKTIEEEIGELIKQFSDTSINRQEVNFALQDIYITYNKINMLREQINSGTVTPENIPGLQAQLDAFITSLNSVNSVPDIISHRFNEISDELDKLTKDNSRALTAEEQQQLNSLNAERVMLKDIEDLIAPSRSKY